MIKKRKAQGLSINVIILAVISLIVLVVLIAILTGQLGIFSKGVSEIQSCNEICKLKDYSGGTSDESILEDKTLDYKILIGARDSDGKPCYCKT